jgi:hypothetical protein
MSKTQHISAVPTNLTGNKDTRDASAGEKAKGAAVADLLVKAVQEQGNKLRMFLVNIAELTQDGRSAFRVAVQAHLRQIRKHVQAVKGTPEEPAYAASARSAGVRLSEAVTFSKAIDAGFSPEWEGVPYHSMIGFARTFLQAEAAVGPTQRRGRKATSPVDKALAYIVKLGLTPAEMRKLEETIHTLKGKPSDVKAVPAVNSGAVVAAPVDTPQAVKAPAPSVVRMPIRTPAEVQARVKQAMDERRALGLDKAAAKDAK